MTVPTTRPRSAGSARWAANGTSNCGVIVVTPTARLAAASQAKFGAAATPSSATVDRPEHCQDERPSLQAVAQGQEQEHSRGVADLREHGDQPHAAIGNAEVTAHVSQEWLDVVDVGDGQTRTNCHCPERPFSRSSVLPHPRNQFVPDTLGVCIVAGQLFPQGSVFQDGSHNQEQA